MLSICSISFYSEKLLEENLSILSRFGEETIREWIVVDNTTEKNNIISPPFKVISGIEREEISTTEKIGSASYHHGRALNLLSRYPFETKYVLFLDPDFFIYEKLSNIIEYMEENQMDFFGASYHPSSIKVGRTQITYNFPVVFCMFVNRESIDVSQFDFTPSKDWDTGYKVYQEYENKSKFECVKPMGNSLANKMDKYSFKGKLFGLHIRGKIHLENRKDDAGYINNMRNIARSFIPL